MIHRLRTALRHVAWTVIALAVASVACVACSLLGSEILSALRPSLESGAVHQGGAVALVACGVAMIYLIVDTVITGENR